MQPARRPPSPSSQVDYSAFGKAHREYDDSYSLPATPSLRTRRVKQSMRGHWIASPCGFAMTKGFMHRYPRANYSAFGKVNREYDDSYSLPATPVIANPQGEAIHARFPDMRETKNWVAGTFSHDVGNISNCRKTALCIVARRKASPGGFARQFELPPPRDFGSVKFYLRKEETKYYTYICFDFFN